MYHSGVNIITQRGSTNLERVFMYMSNKPQSHKLAAFEDPYSCVLLAGTGIWPVKIINTSLYYKP